MKKFLFVLTLAVSCLLPSFAKADTAIRWWYADSATGGGSGSMDGAISGVSINAYDACMVVDQNKNAYIYKVKNDSAAEYSVSGIPVVVAPDDVGAGTTRWHLTKLNGAGVDFLSGTTLPTLNYISAGASTFYVYSGTTLTADMLAGGMLFCHGAAPIVLGIPSITGSTAFFGAWDMTGNGVTVQTTDSQVMYDDSTTAGKAYFVNAGNSRHGASFKVNSESGACPYVIVLGKTGNNWEMK